MQKIAYLTLGLALGIFAMTLANARQELQQYRAAHVVQVPAAIMQPIGGR